MYERKVIDESRVPLGEVVPRVGTQFAYLSVAAKRGTSLAVEREPRVGLRSGLRWGAERGKKLTASSLR
jgi:hypothetical protein